MLETSADERGKQRMAAARRRGEFRVELAGNEPRMLRDLDHLAKVFVCRNARDAHSRIHQVWNIAVVDFITMTMAFHDRFGAIDMSGKTAGKQSTLLTAQAHGAAHVRGCVAIFDAPVAAMPLMDQCDDRMRRGGVEFGAVRALQPGAVPRVFYDGE